MPWNEQPMSELRLAFVKLVDTLPLLRCPGLPRLRHQPQDRL
jgi:hypothetical protein